MAAYYNEIDKYAADWLRNLIAAGLIAPGDVDERSIEDVRPSDLIGYTQCHFFAGIGIWSLAFRRAGWPDDRPVWSGSCPCQPFSAAGQGTGFDDERHLWPAFHHLIKERKPSKVVGEQVASKDADTWIDLVHTDMEALGYAFGAVAFPSAGVGAPHIRDRTYWVADAEGQRWNRGQDTAGKAGRLGAEAVSIAGGMGNNNNKGLPECERIGGISSGEAFADQGQAIKRTGICDVLGLEHTLLFGRQRRQETASGYVNDGQASERSEGEHGTGESSAHRIHQHGTRPTNGFWRDSDWLLCRDGKWRPVEPGTFPLAHGAAARVGRLRAYGNAINAEAATEFIKACLIEN